MFSSFLSMLLSLNSVSPFVLVHRRHSGVGAQWALLDNVSSGKESEPSSIPHGWLVSHQLIKIKRGDHCLHGVGSWIFETRAEGVVYWTGWRDAGGTRLRRRFQKRNFAPLLPPCFFFFSLLSPFEMYVEFLNYCRLIAGLLLSNGIRRLLITPCQTRGCN